MQVLGIEFASVAAAAKASLVPSNVTCIMPVAMCCENAVGGCNNTTFVVGRWYEGRVTPSGPDKDDADSPLEGSFRWIRLPGESGGNDLKDRIEASGACEEIDSVQPVQSENGLKQGVIASYNSRFGVYAPRYSPPYPVPDKTGYPYTEMTPEMQTAGVNRPADATSPRAYLHYKDNSFPNHVPFGTGANKTQRIKDGNDRSGLDIPNNYDVLASSDHAAQNNGLSRRVLALPVVKCGAGGLADASGQTGTPILGWACMLMLHPISTGNSGALPVLENLMRLEYIDAANSVDSPCASGGRPSGPGGTGPRVPGLVQ
jgi:hypothetical protein